MAIQEHFYQAIGELFATLVVADDGTKFLETESARYPALISLIIEQKYLDLYPGQQVYWRVYPQSVEQGLAFKIVSFANQLQKGHGQFILQGDWVEYGQLQIWRNAVAGQINEYNWQPRLLPISWSEAPPPDAAFWQLRAELVDGILKIVSASGPFPHPPRREQPPTSKTKKPRLGPPLPPPQRRVSTGEASQAPEAPTQRELPRGSTPSRTIQPKQASTTLSINWEELTPVSGKLELTIKLNTLPKVQEVDGQCHFQVDCDGQVFQISVKPKQWNKLEKAQTTYKSWIAAIAGKLGAVTADGFVLLEPNIQVFECSDKPSLSQTQDATSPPSEEKNEVGATSKVETLQAAACSSEKPDCNAVPLVATGAKAKPKKIGKFNVEVQ